MNKDQASQRPEFVPIGVDKLALLATFQLDKYQEILNKASFRHLFIPSGEHCLPDLIIEVHYQLIAQHEYLALSEQALLGVDLRIKEIDKILWNDQDKDKNTASLFPSNSQHHLKAMDDEDKLHASMDIGMFAANFKTFMYQSATVSLWSILEQALDQTACDVVGQKILEELKRKELKSETSTQPLYKNLLRWIGEYLDTDALSPFLNNDELSGFKDIRNHCAHGISNTPPSARDVKLYFFKVTEILSAIDNEPKIINRINEGINSRKLF